MNLSTRISFSAGMHLAPLAGIETNLGKCLVCCFLKMHLAPLAGIETKKQNLYCFYISGCISHPLRGLKQKILRKLSLFLDIIVSASKHGVVTPAILPDIL